MTLSQLHMLFVMSHRTEWSTIMFIAPRMGVNLVIKTSTHRFEIC